MAKEVKENQAVKHPTVKCHGKFKTSIKVNAGKGEVVIRFVADQDTVDLNKLGGDPQGRRYSYFCE